MAQMAHSTHTSSTGRDASDTLQDVKDKGMEQVNRMAEKATDTVQDIAGRVVEQGREAAHQVQDAAGSVQSAVNQSIKDQPLATLAAAAVVGFVLGALWKS